MDLNLKELNRIDPLKKNAEVSAQDMGNELSPMSPPEAYEPPSDSQIDYDSLHPFLQNLMDDHVDLKKKLKELKVAFDHPKRGNEINQTTLRALDTFLQFFNQAINSVFNFSWVNIILSTSSLINQHYCILCTITFLHRLPYLLLLSGSFGEIY